MFVSVWTSCRLWSVQLVLSGPHRSGDGHSAEENSTIVARPCETRFEIEPVDGLQAGGAPLQAGGAPLQP